MVHPEDRQAVKLNARDMLRGKSSSPHEFRIVTKQGKVRWVLETVASITFGGRPAILGNSMDITEEKRAQERLRESETWYRTLFETTGAATMILEEDTTISLVNREFVHQFGYTREETENRKSWTEFIAPEDLDRMKEYHRLRRIDPEGPPKNYEFRFINKGGEARNVYLTVDMIPGTRKSIASMVDITDLRRADETLKVRGRELENKTLELEELNAALRVLLKRREEDRNELEEKVLTNVKKLVLPYIEKLKKSPLDPMTRTGVLILESNLRDIIAPFSNKLFSPAHESHPAGAPGRQPDQRGEGQQGDRRISQCLAERRQYLPPSHPPQAGPEQPQNQPADVPVSTRLTYYILCNIHVLLL